MALSFRLLNYRLYLLILIHDHARRHLLLQERFLLRAARFAVRVSHCFAVGVNLFLDCVKFHICLTQIWFIVEKLVLHQHARCHVVAFDTDGLSAHALRLHDRVLRASLA